MNDKKSHLKYGTDRNPFEKSYQEKNRVQETIHLKNTGNSKKVSILADGIQKKLKAIQDEIGHVGPPGKEGERRGKTTMILGSKPSDVQQQLLIKHEYEDGLRENAVYKAKYGKLDIKKNMKAR